MKNRVFLNLKTNAGFTLIEVLIAAILLAGGLLGLAALQTVSLTNNQSASNRSQATQFAYDIADRMRANTAGLAKYTAIFSTPPAAKATCLNTTGCTPAQMAENDLYEWNRALKTLPMGAGTITISGGIYTVKITWDDDGNGVYESDVDPAFKTSFKI